MASKFGLSKMLVILIVVVIVLGSIGVGYFALTQLAAPTASPTPTPSPSPSPTPSPTAAPTPTPAPASTPSPSSTPSPTATPTPAPSPTPTPTLVWNKTYGGTSNDRGHSVVQTTDGGYAITGETDSYGAGLVDVYLVKTDAAGNMLWNKTYGGASFDVGWSVVQTADGGYAIAGYTGSFGGGYSEVYLVRTDSAGNMLWNQTYGGGSLDRGYSVVQTTDGGYAITGETVSYGAGNDDVYLVKTDAAGNMLWNKTYGGTDSDRGYFMVQTADGGYAITGDTLSFGADWQVYLVRTDASGNMLWNKTYGGTDSEAGCSVVQTSDGGYAIAGDTVSFGAGNCDVYLVKTDAAGNMLWNKTYGGTDYDYGFSLVQTADGGYAIAGETDSFGAGFADVYLVKTDASGNMMWNQTYGGTSNDAGLSLVQTSDSGYAIAGTIWSGAGSFDVYLVKTDSAGNV